MAFVHIAKTPDGIVLAQNGHGILVLLTRSHKLMLTCIQKLKIIQFLTKICSDAA
jgi:hypothetical protein